MGGLPQDARGSRRRRWQFPVTVLLLLTAGLFIWSEHQPLPMGQGPAGPEVDLNPIKKLWGSSRYLIVGLGDSITRGVGADVGEGYFDLMTGNNGAWRNAGNPNLKQVLPRFGTLNLSVAGSTSFDLLERQLADLPTQPPTVKGIVCITTGGNDLIHWYGRSRPSPRAMFGCTMEQARKWAPGFEQRLRDIVKAVSSRFPGGCEVFLANIYDPSDGRGDSERAPLPLPEWPESAKIVRLYNEAVSSVASDLPNVHAVDIYTPFLGHGYHCRDWRGPYYDKGDPHYWYFTNLEDPNHRGHDAIRRVFLTAMARSCSTQSQGD